MTSQIFLYIFIGICAGLASGLFGIGGGLIIVPGLIFLAGFSQLSATGTSLAVLIAPVGIAGAIEYYRRGNVNITAAIIIAISLLISALLSARLAHRINPNYLRLAFGVFIILVGIYTIWTSLIKLYK